MNEKVVQTELKGEEYNQLRDITRKRKMSLKEAVREAIREWIRQQSPLSDDPLFQLKPVDTGMPTDSSNLDKDLYGKQR